jgi:hypothetical protein
MKNLVCAAKNKVQGIAATVKKADKGGKEIIVELGLTVVAVALIVVFREQIKTLVDGIMTQATTTITGLFNFV